MNCRWIWWWFDDGGISELLYARRFASQHEPGNASLQCRPCFKNPISPEHLLTNHSRMIDCMTIVASLTVWILSLSNTTFLFMYNNSSFMSPKQNNIFLSCFLFYSRVISSFNSGTRSWHKKLQSNTTCTFNKGTLQTKSTSRSPVMLWYLSLWSVTWRQLETNPREIAADHWRCSCSCWSKHSKRKFEAADSTVWTDGGKTAQSAPMTSDDKF